MDTPMQNEDLKRVAETTPAGEPPQKKAKTELGPDSLSKIGKQLDFWFNNSNFRTDKHLRAESAKDDGWVQLSHLATFGRLKAITTDVPTIASAIGQCKYVVLSDDQTKVKRKDPLPEVDDSHLRTIFVKGLPTKDLTIDAVSDHFSVFGEVWVVRLLTDKGKSKTGEAYIEFATVDEYNKAIAASETDWNPQVKLSITSRAEQQAAIDKKKEEQKAAKEQKEKENQAAALALSEKLAVDLFKPGCLLKVKGIPADYPRDDAKAYFSKFGKVRYIDAAGAPESTILRFFEADGVNAALEKSATKELIIADVVLEASRVEGDEEQEYWKKISPSTGRDARGGRGGRGKGRGRGRGDNRKGGRR